MNGNQFSSILGARTLSESVTARLRDEIVTGQLTSGERLSQDRLAERFGVSRIPIREALRKLSSEGLVRLRAHHSATVSELDAEDIAELAAIAGTLEASATVRGAPRLKAGDLVEMARLLDVMRASEGNPREWYGLNVAFHMVITRASGWSRLIKLVEESRWNTMRYVVEPDVHRSQVAMWHQQHCDIYKACLARDPDLIVALSNDHWQASIEGLVARVGHHAASDLLPVTVP